MRAVLAIALVAIVVGCEEEATYEPARRLHDGHEVLMTVIVSSACGACKAEGLAEAIEQIKLSVERQTAEKNSGFAATAVSLGWDPAEEFEFVGRFGHFDELVLGRNWLNGAARRYVWREFPADPLVPQVVVTTRRINPGPASIEFSDETVLVRKLGVLEIIAWAEAGAQMPAFPTNVAADSAVQ